VSEPEQPRSPAAGCLVALAAGPALLGSLWLAFVLIASVGMPECIAVDGDALAANRLVFAAAAVAVALLWVGAAAVLARGPQRGHRVRAALVLLAIPVLLFVSALAAEGLAAWWSGGDTEAASSCV
jgi:hypothetical protein